MHLRLPMILLLAVAAGCATQEQAPDPPLAEKFSRLEADVQGQGETLRELDGRVGQTNDRMTQQTISVSQLNQTQRRQTKELLDLVESQARLDRSQQALAQRYHALRALMIQTRLDEIRARIEFLRTRQRELETQLRDEQDRPRQELQPKKVEKPAGAER